MLLFFLRQPEAKALLTFFSSIIILILSANSILIPTYIWIWTSSSFLYIVLYFIPVILLMRWFAHGGQYLDIHRANLDGQTFLITGAAGGIGKATACELAKRGARVILFARSTNLTEAINDVRKVVRSSKNIVGYPLDLADLRSIKACVEQFMKNENR
jgi:lactate dehydrogenase-like 2-hydroxyacid dehydrogenase